MTIIQPARQIRGRAWLRSAPHRGAFTLVEITTIGDEPNDTNTDDLNNLILLIPDLGLLGIHDTDRFEYTWTCFWARLDLRCFTASCPVDINKIGRQAGLNKFM